MDADSWRSRFSRKYQSALQARSDLYIGFDEMESDDDHRAEFPCPFCSEDFDMIGLCCHIDEEHPVEAKNGVCPVCAMRVGADMVGHVTMQHGQFFKMQRRKRIHSKGGSHSTLALLRKELRGGNLQALLGSSSYAVPSSNTSPDPLLSSFVYNLPIPDEQTIMESQSSTESSLINKLSDEFVVERSSEVAPLSEEDQKEKAKRSEFVQGLLLSSIFGDEEL